MIKHPGRGLVAALVVGVLAVSACGQRDKTADTANAVNPSAAAASAAVTFKQELQDPAVQRALDKAGLCEPFAANGGSKPLENIVNSNSTVSDWRKAGRALKGLKTKEARAATWDCV